MSPLEHEDRLRGRGRSRIAGVDEVGRGPLAGPVVAAAVILPAGVWIEGAGDSKTLGSARRCELAVEIRARALAVGVGAASVREIDGLNIAGATALAVERALAALPVPPDHVILDGRPMQRLRWQHEAVVRGDATIHSVGCASILAKVVRDGLMWRLADRYPGYGWRTNVGYGTPEHMEALGTFGVTSHHRRSFAPVRLRLEI
ncbi:MAG: ribonuclease HII [Gemmatimonadales bacterium]|nr:MAG: ribonuclease HII [Gemmatimonadales bacterium]